VERPRIDRIRALMAGDLKSFFGRKVVEGLAQDIARAYPKFNVARFTAECLDGLDRLELMPRAWHIAEAMRRHLPQEFPRAARILIRSLGDELQATELNGMDVFRYLPHVFYVSKYGLASFEDAMRVQYELTQRFTAEFSIRAYLTTYPAETLARLREWARDPNVHVRRLVSEGTRPRLPWAPRLRAFQKDPAPVLTLLELLKDDPELYVRRSVANSLNDIAKDHPNIAIDTCRQWLEGANKERSWIVRHALRSLVKAGHPGALALMGAGGVPKVRIERVKFKAKQVRIGGRLEFSFDVMSTGARSQPLLLDYTVHFVKSNGKSAPKVFKLRKIELAPRERQTLSAAVSLKEMTTRKHYPGLHRVEVLINGRSYPLGVVRLVKA
jgi:3-methyladenine DNA glycosylase AlkC